MLVEGSVNFRDMGGVSTRDGRRLAPGRLFRSGTLHAISDRGLAQFAALGVRVAFDLRSDSERAARPPRFPADGSVAFHAYEHERSTGNVFAMLRNVGGDGAALMRKVYRNLPYEFAEPYRRLTRWASSDAGPLVFNCAAGKDRTGVAAALMLAALDVPKDEIYADYMKSESAFDLIVEMFLTGPRGPLVSMLDRSRWEPVLRTDARYLDAMFEGIEERSGSIANYLETELRLDAAARETLRARLLA